MSTTATQAAPATISLSTTPADDPTHIPRGNVEASLSFFTLPPDGSKPYNYVEQPPPNTPRNNYELKPRPVTITDIRGNETSFSLDKDAFQTLSNIHSSPALDPSFTDEQNIKDVYYKEVEDVILKHVPGAKRVVIFDHTIRRSDPNAHRKPVSSVHIDQTPKSALQRVHLHLPAEEAELLAQGRYRIINVWRPLNGPVQANPLAFASSVSTDDADVVPIEHRYPNRTGETAGIKYNQGQKWYYWSGMTNEERLLLKCADSGEGVAGRRVPHSAFVDPRTPAGAVGRESIEVRTLVFG